MAHGPVDFLMIEFEDSSFCPSMATGLKSLLQGDTIRIIDLIFVEKGNDGTLSVLEVGELDDEASAAWGGIVSEIEGMLTIEDAEYLAEELPANHSAVLVMFENVWAREMSRIITEAGGEVTVGVRIPGAVIAELETFVD